MIVNPRQNGWEVIFQRSHAMLAAQLAYYHPPQARNWFSTLAAVLQHDDEERHWEGTAHLTEAGTPLDFTLSVAGLNLDQLNEKLRAVAQQDRWAGLLIARHMSALYEEFRGENKALGTFLDELRKQQATWYRTLDVTQADVEAAYAVFRWADQLSLILCKRQVPDGGRALDVQCDAGGTLHRVSEAEHQTLRLDPWVYHTEPFTVQVEARILTAVTFKDEKSLLAALETAEVETLSWTFVP